MRTVQLARLAARSEILLLRRNAGAVARRAAYGAVAAVFAIGALTLLHVLGFLALRQYAHIEAVGSAAIVLGVDVVIAAIFGVLASGAVKDPIAAEARLVRDQSLEQMRESLTSAAMIRPAARLLGRKHIYGVVLAALTARFLGSRV